VEATAPHRIVHANAAFCRSIIIPNHHQKIDETTTPTTLLNQVFRSSSFLHVPVTVFPVVGSSFFPNHAETTASITTTHYLIEAAEEPDDEHTSSHRQKREVPARTVG
jgi:hypothetical protein